MTDKVTVATVWLDGCSGCHMSFLDIDERIIDLAGMVDLVYSPLVDAKEYPAHVDVAIVEGAISTDEDDHKIRMIRDRSTYLIALGDCAVGGNVPTIRNGIKLEALFDYAYDRNATIQAQWPKEELPTLNKKVVPIHEIVPVDVFVQGCPPSADTIWFTISELLAGRVPDLGRRTRPGA